MSENNYQTGDKMKIETTCTIETHTFRDQSSDDCRCYEIKISTIEDDGDKIRLTLGGVTVEVDADDLKKAIEKCSR